MILVMLALLVRLSPHLQLEVLRAEFILWDDDFDHPKQP
jgi:hypothetical protein